jgi:uncharacterized protein
MAIYQPPTYLTNGLLQTFITDVWYGKTWKRWGDKVFWLNHLPTIPWEEHIFTGADGVPLWGLWSCPHPAKGTLILNTGITGEVRKAWYVHVLARKAYKQGFAVLLYDWRGHGRTAELSPVPSSYGWREGADQIELAQQLVKMGCPAQVALVGFSLGGQLALWGLKAAMEQNCTLIKGGAVLSPHLESSRSLAYLRTSVAGRAIERFFVKNLRKFVAKRQQLFPETVKSGALKRINSIDSFDREIVIDYYGFASVAEYYEKTSALYFLDKLTIPYFILYSQDDPMFEPNLIAELQARVAGNPQAYLLMTKHGGHTAHISKNIDLSDKFWGMNRLLEFCEKLMNEKESTSIVGSNSRFNNS